MVTPQDTAMTAAGVGTPTVSLRSLRLMRPLQRRYSECARIWKDAVLYELYGTFTVLRLTWMMNATVRNSKDTNH